MDCSLAQSSRHLAASFTLPPRTSGGLGWNKRRWAQRTKPPDGLEVTRSRTALGGPSPTNQSLCRRGTRRDFRLRSGFNREYGNERGCLEKGKGLIRL